MHKIWLGASVTGTATANSHFLKFSYGLSSMSYLGYGLVRVRGRVRVRVIVRVRVRVRVKGSDPQQVLLL